MTCKTDTKSVTVCTCNGCEWKHSAVGFNTKAAQAAFTAHACKDYPSGELAKVANEVA
jgi:hypothetical protein